MSQSDTSFDLHILELDPATTDMPSSLRTMTKPVDTAQEYLPGLVREMFRLMLTGGGVGLAAPQVGLGVSLAVVAVPERDPILLLNPSITDSSTAMETDTEGCLSIPGYLGQVSRPQSIELTNYRLDGEPVIITATGYEARVIQHEIDHLNAILYTDKLVGELMKRPSADEVAAMLAQRSMEL